MVGLGLKSQGSAPEFTGESRQLSCIYIVKWLCSKLFIISWSNQENQNPQQLWSKTDSNLRKDQPNSRAVVQSVGSGVRLPSPHPPFYQRLTSCVNCGHVTMQLFLSKWGFVLTGSCYEDKVCMWKSVLNRV